MSEKESERLHFDAVYFGYSVEIQLPQFSFCRLFATIHVPFVSNEFDERFENDTNTESLSLAPCVCVEVSVLKGKQKVTIKINQNTIFLFITQFSLILKRAQRHKRMGVLSYVTKIEKKNMNIVELRSRLARYWKCSMRAGKAFAKKRLHMDLKLSVS